VILRLKQRSQKPVDFPDLVAFGHDQDDQSQRNSDGAACSLCEGVRNVAVTTRHHQLKRFQNCRGDDNNNEQRVSCQPSGVSEPKRSSTNAKAAERSLLGFSVATGLVCSGDMVTNTIRAKAVHAAVAGCLRGIWYFP
jgi:hypothetical protein